MTTAAGFTADMNADVDEVLLPWCGALKTVARKSGTSFTRRNSAAASMSPVSKNDTLPCLSFATIEALLVAVQDDAVVHSLRR